MGELVGKVLEVIRRERLFVPGERVAVACSGGADSVALVLLLTDLKSEFGLRLSVAHLNHRLRGEAADADEAFVRRLAERLGLEFFAERADVAARAQAHRTNQEEAGRQARLEFFASLCAQGRADAVAVAHTLDDQAETLLARLVRGTGLAGLAGIQPVLELNPGRIARPLLELRRVELRAFLAERQEAWCEDATNLDRARTRSRLRLELLPGLERLNPATTRHLAQLAAEARQEEEFWQVFIEERFQTLAQRQGDAWRIAASQLLEPLGDFYSGRGAGSGRAKSAQGAVARRLVRRLVAAVQGNLRRLTREHVEQILRLAASGRSGRRLALPGHEVERSFEWMVFRTGKRLPASYSYEVRVPGRVEIEAARARLEFKLVAASDMPRGYNGAKLVALDADTLEGLGALTVRNWRPGDRYQPAGAARPKKLKTLFQRARVAREERAGHPVLVSAGEIVWAPRFGVAARCAVGERTRTALVIVEEPLPEMRR